MSYTYNNKKIKEILDSKGLSKRKVRIALKMANDITVQRWIAGEDIYIGRLLELCNKFNLSPLDFIEYNGKPIDIDSDKSKILKETINEPSNKTESKLIEEQSIAEIKMQCKDDIYAIREELHRQEITHIREVADLTVRIREEERIRLFEQREQDRLKYKQEMDELRKHTEQLLSEKEKEVSSMLQKMNDMQLEYKELELSATLSGSRYKTPIAVADQPIPYKKTKP